MQKEIPFGVWLRKQRRALDFSRQAFADQVGCAEVTLRRIEAGTPKPSKELASILIEKLGIPESQHSQWVSFARGFTGFPPHLTQSPEKPKSNLSAPLTIGWQKEQSEVSQLLAQQRVVTHSSVLQAQLFGGFSLIYDRTAVVGINSARLQSLLAFLIL